MVFSGNSSEHVVGMFTYLMYGSNKRIRSSGTLLRTLDPRFQGFGRTSNKPLKLGWRLRTDAIAQQHDGQTLIDRRPRLLWEN